MLLTWDSIKTVTHQNPLSSRQILEAIGCGYDKYQRLQGLVPCLVDAGELTKTLNHDPRVKRGYLYECRELSLKPCRTQKQVESDAVAGVTRRDSAGVKIENLYEKELHAVRTIANAIIQRHGRCTTDVLRDRFTGYLPPHAWGKVFRLKLYKVIGRKASTIKTNNGRSICVWAFSD